VKEKNYVLTPEQEAEVAKVVAEGQAKYAAISHIVWESEIDASVFFEHELNADSNEPA